MCKFIGFVCGIVLMPFTLGGTTRHVYESDGAQGIQHSINVSGAYDTVMVHTGTYWVRDVAYTGIVMKDSVRLISPHPDSVTLSGLNSMGTDTAYHVIFCYFGDSSSHEALICGFTITNGNANGSEPHNSGGGLFCVASSPTIDSCVIENNRAENGGGVFISQSSPIITDNTIRNNSASYGAGGLLIYDNSSPTISSSIISSNSANDGGGLLIDSSFAMITDNIIKNNFALDYGGGILIKNSSPTITNNTINNNSSQDGAGILMYHSSSIITDNTIKNNSGSGYAGGIYVYHYSSPKITNNTIDNNSSCFGGGMYIEYFSSPIMSSNVITNNIGDLGGAFSICESSNAVVERCFIVDNGSIGDTKSGVNFILHNADTFKITNSHLYYNTFQPDIEIDNNTSITIPHKNNFWWDTTEVGIAGLIEGPADLTPWEYDFIPGVPGEPILIDSIHNYDSSYSFIVDSLGNDPDTLYLKICGEDRNAEFREVAVAIIKSNVYPGGIAVALVETDTNSGIYQGRATIKVSTGSDTIRLDDIYNIVKVNSICDTITITANMDSFQSFKVYYNSYPGIEEANKSQILNPKSQLYVYPNPFTHKTSIQYVVGSRQENLSTTYYLLPTISIYDLSGRLVETYEVTKSTKSNTIGKNLKPGIYFVKVKGHKPVKIVKLR